ncbi:MAG: fibronectin type III domain-containing protein, partial [Actinomycetota bacterium]
SSAAQGGAGGLVGLTESDLVITRSYATGRVAGSPEAGGLVGGNLVGCAGVGVTICSADVHVTQTAAATSFWDSATTGQSASHGGYGTAKSTAEMQALATYAAAGWPIARGFSSTAGTTWGICPSANGGYPFLQNRYAAATQPCAGTPGKPRKVRMTAGDGTVTVAWEAPAADGGAPVASYTATAQMQKATGKAAPSCTVTAADTSCTITGLRNGRAYRVTLTAANVEGAGTPTARTVTPSRGLVVLSTRRSGLGVVTRVRVREAGRLTQAGTVAGLGARACRATSAVRKAGVVELRCALTPAALAALAERALDVRVVTRFTPTAGERRSAVRRVVFARTDAAGAVTG